MLFIPIGLDQTTVRRLPWVSFAIIALNLVAFLLVGASASSVEQEAGRRAQEVVEFWTRHPYLKLPEEVLPPGMSRAEREKLTLLVEAMRSAPGQPTADAEQRDQEQKELQALVEHLREGISEHPVKSWGLVPSNPKPVAFLTSMFMHASWLHLLGNMLFFYISGPFTEDAYGRPLFAALYLASGVVSSLAHVAAFPNSEAPLVGASGAIAGIMGAFLVRFVRTKIRFFYFYFLFLFRSGTVDVPAWIVLPLWFLQQLFFASLAGSSGVAYRAHVGGFAFGFVAALAIRHFRIEERFIAPGIEKEISVTQHPALDEGLDLLARGDTMAARGALHKVLATEPRNADAHLAIWHSHCQDGTAAEGVEHVVRAMDEELRRGDTALALEHWREMVAGTRQGGPGALRFRLATMLESGDREGAVEVLRDLARDTSAGLLAEKATRRLVAMGAAPAPEREAGTLPAAAPPMVKPLAAKPAPLVQPTPSVFELGPEPLQAVAEDPSSMVFADAPAPEEAPLPASLEVEVCSLEAVNPEGLMLRGTEGAPELLPFADVETVSVAGITGSERPYLVLDLLLHTPGVGPRKVERLLSSQFDPRHLIGRPDLPPLEAFRELVRIIAEAAGATLAPDTLLSPSAKIPIFASIEEYQRAVLMPDS